MGTNIYLRKIVSREKIEETKRKLKEMADEYGNAYSLDDLKEDLESHKDGFDHDSYVKRIRKIGEFPDDGGIEFISDSLRWSRYDFS